MNLETKDTLPQDTIDKLQSLIQANIDSCEGFEEAAEKIDDSSVAQAFRRIARQRAGHISELSHIVQASGVVPRAAGSAIGSLHRYFIDFRAALNGGDPYVVLAEAERGEDHIKDLYENVLKATAGSAANDVLQRQYADVKMSHDQVRDLRDARKND